jgi:hypothetical protein
MFLFSKTQNYKLGDLFEITQGSAIISNKSLIPEESSQRYKTIYISNLTTKYEALEFVELKDYFPNKKIKEGKLITSKDYIITCKGVVKGYAMCKAINLFKDLKLSNHKGIIASNHFIVLKPRQSTLEIFENSYLLYHLLDMIIPEFNNYINQNATRKKLPYITISEIENFSISLPGSSLFDIIKEFQSLYNKRKQVLTNLIEIDEKLSLFNKDFLNNLIK